MEKEWDGARGERGGERGRAERKQETSEIDSEKRATVEFVGRESWRRGASRGMCVAGVQLASDSPRGVDPSP